jgi:hypothetical protein
MGVLQMCSVPLTLHARFGYEHWPAMLVGRRRWLDRASGLRRRRPGGCDKGSLGPTHLISLLAAVQDEAQFAPGGLVVVWVESQAIGSKVQHYKVIDAALGVTERGSWKVTDAVAEQPWLPNGPIPLQVTWTRPATDPRFGAVA